MIVPPRKQLQRFWLASLLLAPSFAQVGVHTPPGHGHPGSRAAHADLASDADSAQDAGLGVLPARAEASQVLMQRASGSENWC